MDSDAIVAIVSVVGSSAVAVISVRSHVQVGRSERAQQRANQRYDQLVATYDEVGLSMCHAGVELRWKGPKAANLYTDAAEWSVRERARSAIGRLHMHDAAPEVLDVFTQWRGVITDLVYLIAHEHERSDLAVLYDRADELIDEFYELAGVHARQVHAVEDERVDWARVTPTFYRPVQRLRR